MKSSSTAILAAMLATLVLGGCKKPAEPSTPANPEPKAEATDPNAPGTTTNYEAPAQPAKPAGQ